MQQQVDAAARRRRMVDHELAGRELAAASVLDALRAVPRDRFLPDRLAEFAYDDVALPIGDGETIAMPSVIAAMTTAAELDPTSRVLEIGTGTGYGAAVLGLVAGEVWTVERSERLAGLARHALQELGSHGVHVRIGDGSAGLADEAPFDAILVTTGAVAVTAALAEQLVDGGRIVALVGPDGRDQRLVRMRRRGDDLEREELGAVGSIALAGRGTAGAGGVLEPVPAHPIAGVASLVREVAEPFESIAGADVGALLDRVGECPVVLLGEASHGTSEFYRMRAHITRELIVRKGFTAVAVEADWPDAARIDAYVRRRRTPASGFETFARFPTWMWRNHEVRSFVDWLFEHNGSVGDAHQEVSFHGLDLYSLYTSRDAVISYLDSVDADAAALARHRYGCLSPWEQDPASYGRAVVSGRFAGCEDQVVEILDGLLRRRLELAAAGGDEFVDAVQNALVVANAERYYRIMYYGSRESWNLRDLHMFETLQLVRSHRGPDAKVVVWEHNSHVGDASATEMGARGEHNVGMLARQAFGEQAFLVGFGTHDGVVAAATDWGGPMEHKAIRPSHPDSYERICHDAGIPAFVLHLREPRRADVRSELGEPHLERAIGVIYRPETELQSHYFNASLPRQFDEYVWFDRTSPVRPIAAHDLGGLPDTYPFGL